MTYMENFHSLMKKADNSLCPLLPHHHCAPVCYSMRVFCVFHVLLGPSAVTFDLDVADV